MIVSRKQWEANRALGGNLAGELARLRDEGHNYEQIARWLLTEHGVNVSRNTVQNWHEQYLDDAAEAAR